MKLIIFFLIMTTATSFSQNNFIRNNTRVIAEEIGFAINSRRVIADGSPYISEKFEAVKIKSLNDHVHFGRYNAYNGRMEIKLENEIIALDNTKVSEIIFLQFNKVYRTYKYKSENKKQKNRFLLIVKETKKYILLKEEIITFTPKIPPKSGFETEIPAKYIRENDKFYLKLDNTITYIPTRKKDLLKTFPGHSKKLKNYIKENNLSTKKEKDIIKIVEYLSSL